MVRNVHERRIAASADEVGGLLDRIGGPGDPLWPVPAWPPMVLDRLAVGGQGGHGPIRYAVSGYRPGRLVEFTFAPGLGLTGTHTLEVLPLGSSRSLLRHVVAAGPTGRMRWLWPLAVRWLHDALIEDLFDRAETAVGARPARPAAWSPWVRLLRAAAGRRAAAGTARTVPVPATPMLAAALPRVDWSDAFAVRRGPGTPDDPQAWADAVFKNPPGWVRALFVLRQSLVGLVGIERGDESTFATLQRAEREILLGADAGHLDFRAGVLVEPRRVVVSTLVRLHGWRGRLYSTVVRRVHPVVVRGMMARAARTMAGAGGAGAATGAQPAGGAQQATGAQPVSGAGSPSASRISGGISRLPEPSVPTTT